MINYNLKGGKKNHNKVSNRKFDSFMAACLHDGFFLVFMTLKARWEIANEQVTRVINFLFNFKEEHGYTRGKTKKKTFNVNYCALAFSVMSCNILCTRTLHIYVYTR